MASPVTPSRHAAVSLREHLETLIDGLKQLLGQRIDATERAVGIAMSSSKEADAKAEAANDRRFASVNEFRAALSDLVARLMPRAESEQRHAAARERIDLMVQRSEAQGHWKTFSDKLEQLDTRLTRIEGAGVGVRGTWMVLVAVMATIVSVGGFILAIVH